MNAQGEFSSWPGFSSSPPGAVDVLTAIEVLSRRVQQLEQQVAQLQRRRHTPDTDVDARFLSAIAAVFGAAPFSAADLQASSDAELRAILGLTDIRTLGAWLRRLRRTPIPPYALHKIKRDGAGVVWMLRCM